MDDERLTQDDLKSLTRDELEALCLTIDGILVDRNRLLAAIPPCLVHGPCVPFAVEWVQNAKVVLNATPGR